MRYPVFLERTSDGSYGVGVPDMLGCVSAGDSVEEALEQVREAIIFHLEGMAEDGQEPPEPGSIDQHAADPDWQTADYWALVEVPEQDLPGKAVRLNITMNERVLARLDAAAEAQGATRSGLLQRLAGQHVAGRAAAAITPRKQTPRKPKPRKSARDSAAKVKSKRPAKARSSATGRKRDRGA